ncbi:hypothetical protein [Parvibaculum sp.]|uniref:hypothetical protein n=1 Tax=Parvibaculum sp. TaxID=2024848 RepID=UPI001DE12C52|nr:hypothetical protein [Parvibaculum sp.]MBX3489796.1 hypothetical protein [Parvibaculum sp.]
MFAFAIALIFLGLSVVVGGALLMRYSNRLGRIVAVAGSTLLLVGTLWQIVSGLF